MKTSPFIFLKKEKQSCSSFLLFKKRQKIFSIFHPNYWHRVTIFTFYIMYLILINLYLYILSNNNYVLLTCILRISIWIYWWYILGYILLTINVSKMRKMGIFKDFNNNWIDSQNGVLCLCNFSKSRQRKRTCVVASPGIVGRCRWGCRHLFFRSINRKARRPHPQTSRGSLLPSFWRGRGRHHNNTHNAAWHRR